MTEKIFTKGIISRNDLEEIGLPINQAKRVIRESKKNAVKAGFTFYGGKQNFAPTKFVVELLGVTEII